MDDFILIFRHQDGRNVASPDQIKVWMQQTKEWMDGLPAPGKIVNGQGLEFDGAKVVHSDKTVTNGPYGEIKETLGGYLIVQAESMDDVVAFAKKAPILQGEGNTMEVRKIAHNDGMHK